MEEIYEKTMANGCIMTIAKVKGGFDVDQWNEDGSNRWNRFYTDAEKAQAEYDRWN